MVTSVIRYLILTIILYPIEAHTYENLLDHNVQLEEKDKGCFLQNSRQISKVDFQKLGSLDNYHKRFPDGLESDSISLKDNKNAIRDGLKLILKTKKGMITLKNLRNAENGHDKNYYFAEENEKCSFYLMFYNHGEFHSWLLMSSLTGKKLDLIGKPHISDDCKNLVSYNLDSGLGSTITGIQHHQLTERGYEEVCFEKNPSWNFHGGFWKGDNFYFKIGKHGIKTTEPPSKTPYYNWFFKFRK